MEQRTISGNEKNAAPISPFVFNAAPTSTKMLLLHHDKRGGRKGMLIAQTMFLKRKHTG